MSSPEAEKKRKKTKTSLPDDLLLSCIARVSRLYYPTLSLVSKEFRSLLASPELYNARSLLGHKENCLYVCFSNYPGHRWFTLCRKPNQNLTTGATSGYTLVRVPVSRFPTAFLPSVVAVGSDIYKFGGPTLRGPSSTVAILDCRSHTWREGPSLPVKLREISASVFDQKIYVTGSFKGPRYSDSFKSFEVFDTRTRTWEPKPIPCNESEGKFVYRKKGRINVLPDGKVMSPRMHQYSICEIENVVYYAYNGWIAWYDSESSVWRSVTGLEGLPEFPSFTWVRLAGYGGKMAVMWEDYMTNDKSIWCMEIALERRSNSEIWGKIEWYGHVLTVRESCMYVKALVATV